jgi:hypothetical protein
MPNVLNIKIRKLLLKREVAKILNSYTFFLAEIPAFSWLLDDICSHNTRLVLRIITIDMVATPRVRHDWGSEI